MNSARIDSLNPVTRLALIIILTTPLLLSVDWVSASVSLALTLVLSPFCGIGWLRLAKLAWPLFIAAPLSGISMLLYGAPRGEIYAELWLITISENSVELAVAITLRVLAVALPVIVLARGMNPTELGDALSQVWHLPERFVIGAVAGVRLVSCFRDDWQAMGRARRARGLTTSNRLQRVASMSFGLLVLALRRGGKLATAMEARGFGRTPPGGGRRTWARESRLRARDWWALGLTVLIAAVPVVTSVSIGAWRFFGL
ncbi:energy-coupling factor transporter transmembrane protein EcfT [Corynebacterium sp.]|uniref:energy-coupling factor transporter transmembrane component T family protein n=1 Tax=Corynebacterium sp. TaxID=1720 RepID=UPI0026DCBD47|nr:energy-coupling factor transporter transmembrane component T [Corynebacterium sp.]MDO5032369.1 energy-coupling factor transporter transmembrane component T [Corynebacterium sp.]